MVRGTLTINTKLERARLTRRQKRPNEVVPSEKAVEFQLLLTNRFEAPQLETTGDLDTYNNNLTFPKGLDSTNAAIIFKNTTTLKFVEQTYLPSEVRDAVKRLKCDKAPEEDNITAGILYDGGGGGSGTYCPDVHEAVQ